MSAVEREMELVAGTIGGITQKKADTWTIQVTPEGSEYAKNLWTKSTSLVEALAAKLGQHGAFVCNASYWTMNDGKQVRSLWIEAEANGTENIPERVATPAPAAQPAAPQSRPAGEGMSKEEWARKDSAGHKRACIAIAVSALTHTMPSDPTQEQLNHFNANVLHLALGWHRLVLAERDDPTGEDVPF
jgi:hypothetical protein